MPNPSIHHQDSGSGTLVRMDYGYNAVHDRTYERFGAGGSPGEAFEYDKMRRLTKAWMGSSTPSSPSGQPHTETIDFNMDDDGNRSSKVHTAYLGSPVSTSYTTNSLNQYTAVGGSSLTYDGNGNLVDDGTYYYEYDYRNQLIEVGHSGGAVIATYRYDATGRRVEKNVSGPGITRFILSGLEVIETCAGQTTWAQSFVYADGIDHVVSMRQADVLDWDADLDTSELVWSYYHRNALGSVMFISEPDETEAATYRYTPYGEMTIKRGGFVQGSDPLDQDIGYTGRWYDAEAGLWQYRARAYSAVTGRFLQQDPKGLSVAPGLYEYAWSRPTQLCDPLGLDPVDFGDAPPALPDGWGERPHWRGEEKRLRGRNGGCVDTDMVDGLIAELLGRTVRTWQAKGPITGPRPHCVCKLTYLGAWTTSSTETRLRYGVGDPGELPEVSTPSLYLGWGANRWVHEERTTTQFWVRYLVDCVESPLCPIPDHVIDVMVGEAIGNWEEIDSGTDRFVPWIGVRSGNGLELYVRPIQNPDEYFRDMFPDAMVYRDTTLD